MVDNFCRGQRDFEALSIHHIFCEEFVWPALLVLTPVPKDGRTGAKMVLCLGCDPNKNPGKKVTETM